VVPPPGYNGPFTVTVAAYDYAGNVSKTAVTLQVDTTAPDVSFVSPAENAYVHGTADVTVSTTAPDIDHMYAIGDGGFPIADLSPVAGTNLWRAAVPIGSLERLRIKAFDKAGNEGSAIRAVRIDNEPPAGGTIGPESGTKVHGTFTSTLTGVSDLSGVAKAELWRNGSYVGADTTEPYALPVNTGSYTGPVTLTWKVTDIWGQFSTVTDQVVADNKGPLVAIAGAPGDNAKVKGTVKVSVRGFDPSGMSAVELLVNGKVVARDTTVNYLLTLNTKGQAATMKIQVRGYDRLGNATYTGTRTWYRA